jgi:membrane-associated phospholipid phosphatase
MLYFGKCIPVSLLAFLLFTVPPNAAGAQSERPAAAVSGSVESGTDVNNGTADAPASPDPSTVKPSGQLSETSWTSALHTLALDQKDIWLSPSKLGTHELPWLLPIAGATAAMTQFDTRVAGALPNSSTQLSVSRAASQAGVFGVGGLAAAFYFGGRFTGSTRARETGILTAEAIAETQGPVQVLKFAIRRERPDGSAWSFPSGHAAATWAAAAVISREYYDRKLVRYGIYALPALVSAARIGAEKHYVSDVIAGAAIGNLIGAFVYRRHHDSELGGAPVKPRSPLLPTPGVQFEPHARVYALSLTWQR